MANCISPTKQYIATIEQLISVNPTRYNNYDNAVDFVLNNDILTSQQKKTAIIYFAQIYKELNNRDSKTYDLGKANDVLRVLTPEVLGDDTKSIKILSEIFDTKKIDPIKESSIIKDINEFNNSTFTISREDVKGLLLKIRAFVNGTNFSNTDEKEAITNNIKKSLIDMLSSNNIPSSVKTEYMKFVEEFFISLDSTTKFIDIDTIKELNLENEFMAIYESGAVGLVTKVDDIYYDHNGEILDTEGVTLKPIRNPNKSTAFENGEITLEKEILNSGFQFKAINADQQVILDTLMAKSGIGSGIIRVKAVALSDLGNQRVAKMQEIAQNDDTKNDLHNRTFETYESTSQKKILSTDKDARIITVRRPNKEDGISLVGVIEGADVEFHMYNLDFYTIVDANNNTEAFDFSNNDHIDLLRKMGLVSENRKTRTLTENEIQKLIVSHKRYNKFKESIISEMDNRQSVDVTDEFFNVYGLTTVPKEEEYSLYELMQVNKEFYLPVTVATLKGKEEQSIDQNFKLGVIFKQRYNKQTGEFELEHVPVLKNNQRIKIIVKGQPKYLTEEAYFEIKHPNLERDLRAKLKRVNKEYKKSIVSGENKFYSTSLAVKFYPSGIVKGYFTANTAYPTDYADFFMDFVHNFLSLKENSDSVKDFQKVFGFYPYRSTKKDSLPFVLNFNFHPNQKLFKGMTLELFASSKMKDVSDFAKYMTKENKEKYFNFPLNKYKSYIANFISSINPLVTQVIEDYKSIGLEMYDPNDSESILAFFQELFPLSLKQEATDSLKELMNTIELFSTKFTDKLTDEAMAYFKKGLKAIHEAEVAEGKEKTILDLLKENYFYKGEVTSVDDIQIEYLMREDKGDGKQHLKLKASIGDTNFQSTLRSVKFKVWDKVVSAQLKENRNNAEKPKKPVTKHPQVKTKKKVAKTTKTKNQTISSVDEINKRHDAEIDAIGVVQKEVTEKTPPPSSEEVAEVLGDKTAEETLKDLGYTEDDIIAMTDDEMNQIIAIKKENKPDNELPDEQRLSIEDGDIDIATDDEVATETEWLAQMLPQFKLSEKDIQDIVDLTKIDGTVLGAFMNRIIYLNKSIQGKGTVYHEAYHGVHRYMLTDPKRTQIITNIKKQKKYKKYFTNTALKEFGRKRNSVLSLEELANLQAEEILADGFKDYMINKTKPKGLLARLFEALKRLIAMFSKHKRAINSLYSKINAGYYKSAVVESGIFDNKLALKSIPGLINITEDNHTIALPLSSVEQSALENIVLSRIVAQSDNLTFEEKFNKVTDELLMNDFKLTNLLSPDNRVDATKPINKELAKKTLLPKIQQYRFVLGARMDSEKYGNVYDLNNTGDITKRNMQLDNNIKTSDGEIIDNKDGSYSKDILSQQVEKLYNAVVQFEPEQTDDDLEEVLKDVQNGETISESNEDEIELAEVEKQEFDKSANEQDPLNNIKYIRAFLTRIENKLNDTDLNLRIPHVIDSKVIFPLLLRITAGKPIDQILPEIKMRAEQMLKDGYHNTYEDLIALYNKVVEDTGFDEKLNIPRKNVEFFNQFIETMHVLELDVREFKYATNEISSGPDGETSQSHKGYLRDSIITTDINRKKNALINAMQQAFRNADPEFNKQYKEAIENILRLSENFRKSSENKPNVLTGNKEIERLNTLVNDWYTNLNAIGLKLPKSLIEVSILAIDVKTYNQEIGFADKSLQDIYKFNEDIVDEDQFLSKAFFTNIATIVNKIYNGDRKNPGFDDYIDDNIEQQSGMPDKESRSAFLGAFKDAIPYIIKYDPGHIISIIRNAEGKNIYRYTKYNPLSLMTIRIRRKGLLAELQSDPLYEDYLKDYIHNNIMFKDYLNGVDNEKTREIDLFLNNLKITTFGGIQQTINGQYRKGKTFKGADSKALHLMSIASFLNRKTLSKDGTTAMVYDRSFHQLEATNTHYLITALYRPFTNNKGRKDYNGRHPIVAVLESVVKQEYERMRDNYAKADKRKENYDNRVENKLINKYNAVLNDDKTTAKVDDENLRAYNFNELSNFWEQEDIQELKNKIKSNAKQGLEFNSLTEDELKSLLDGLHKYAQSEFDNYLDRLVELNIIKKKIIENTQGVGNVPGIIYTSKTIQRTLKIDFQEAKKLKNQYAIKQSGPNNKDEGLEWMLYDHFMNNWSNTMLVNQILIGDVALGTINDTDFIKRMKKFAAMGSVGKFGTHKVAVINTLTGYIHPDYKQYGPYRTIEEIYEDPKPSLEEKQILENDFGKKGTVYEIFDGQSVSSLMHQMEGYNQLGRLNERTKAILIKKHYTSLTNDEIKELEKVRIVNNSKKTVTASRHFYLKLSETYIDRGYVSLFVMPDVDANDPDYEAKKAKRYKEIHLWYSQIYEARQDIQNARKQNRLDIISDLQDLIRNNIKLIHANFQPMMHRKELHDMLNAMEYHQVDQLVDPTASKNATILPVDINEIELIDGYLPLHLSSIDLRNDSKYLQVETSGYHKHVTLGNQKKILLPANIKSFVANDASLTKKDKKDLLNYLNDHDNALFGSAQARINYVKKVIREDGDLDIKSLYKLIQIGLKNTGADAEDISLFDINEDGTVATNQNMVHVRSVVEFFLFSHYSNNINTEKVSGIKNYIKSGYGYKVIVNENDEVITTDNYKKNPEFFTEDNGYTSRQLGVTEKIVNGRTHYYAECILPMPMFEKESDKEFYKKFMTEIFAARIPTEDKRSMVALKVVDFVDASELNTIIVPYFVHILAGSDFDIDSLFGQMYATYRDAKGNLTRFNDYKDEAGNYIYGSKEKGEYIEYIHFFEDKSDMKGHIKEARNELAKEDYLMAINPKEPIYDLLTSVYDFSPEEIAIINEYDDLYKQKRALEDRIQQLYSLKEEEKDLLNNKLSNELKDKKSKLQHIRALNRDRFEKISEKGKIDTNINKAQEIYALIKRYVPLFKAFEKLNLPADFKSFKENNLGALVEPKHQNVYLDTSLKLLTHPEVFNKLYINKESSNEMFKEALMKFGLTVEKMVKKGDINTVMAMIEARDDNSMNKDSLSIAAMFQKFLGVASQYDIELQEQAVIWNFKQSKKKGYKQITKNSFSGLNEANARAIEVNGILMGIFADGVKTPIPAAMNVNEVNVNVSLLMNALGLPLDFVMAFNFLPEIKNATLAVKAEKSAIGTTLQQQNLYFNNALNFEIQNLINNDSEVLDELKRHGIAVDSSGTTKKVSKGNFRINTKDLVINFIANDNLNQDRLKKGLLSSEEIGFSVKTTKTEVLSSTAQKIVLLKLYEQQASQLFNLNKGVSVTTFFKKLNPNITSFDRIWDNFKWLKNASENNIFTKESMEKIFADSSIYSLANEVYKDLQRQLDKLFIERSPLFKPFVDLFSKKLIKEKSVIGRLIVGQLGIKMMRHSLSKNTPSTELERTVNDLETQMVEEIFTPDFLYSNTLMKEINLFREQYPENKFLLQLTEETNGDIRSRANKNNNRDLVSERTIRIANKAVIKHVLASEVKKDLIFLYNTGLEGRMFIKKLYYSELMRTGMQFKEGSFLNYFPKEIQSEISDNMTNFIDYINNEQITNDGLQAFLGDDIDNVISDFLNNIGLEVLKEGTLDKIKEGNTLNANTRTLFYKAVADVYNLTEYKDIKNKIEEEISKIFPTIKSDLIMKGMGFLDKSRNPIKSFTLNAPENYDVAIGVAVRLKRGLSATILYEENNDGDLIQSTGFSYPLLYKNGEHLYRLTKIDNKNLSFEELSKYDKQKSLNQFTEGKEAKYELIDKTSLLTNANYLGWNKQERARHKELIERKDHVRTIARKTINVEDIKNKEDWEKLQSLYDEKTEIESKVNSQSTNPKYVLLDEWIRLAYDDVIKETAGKIGKNQDIHKNFVSKSGTPYWKAAEIHMSNHPEWNMGDREIANIMNEILVGTNRLEQMRKENSSIDEIKMIDIEIKELEDKLGIVPIHPIEVGRFVKYKKEIYMISKQNANGTWQIINPTKKDAKSKLSVKEENLIAMSSSATSVRYANSDYLVTDNNTIFSLRTNKKMNWDSNSSHRIAILKSRDANKKIELENMPDKDIKNNYPQNENESEC